MSFKPTKWKVIGGIGAIVLWVLIANLYRVIFVCGCPCAFCPMSVCGNDYSNFMLIKPACPMCSCDSLADVILSNLLNIIIPFIIVYIIWSLIQKPSKKKGKRK